MRFRKRKWPKNMDIHCVGLCDAMNALPGITTFESCCGHGESTFRIWFTATDPQGLFILTRCSDRRYWRYGHRWTIELSVGDDIHRYPEPKDSRSRIKLLDKPPRPGDVLPTHFCLSSHGAWGARTYRTRGQKAYDQAQDLVRNILWHLNRETAWMFIDGYGIDLNQIDLVKG